MRRAVRHGNPRRRHGSRRPLRPPRPDTPILVVASESCQARADGSPIDRGQRQFGACTDRFGRRAFARRRPFLRRPLHGQSVAALTNRRIPAHGRVLRSPVRSGLADSDRSVAMRDSAVAQLSVLAGLPLRVALVSPARGRRRGRSSRTQSAIRLAVAGDCGAVALGGSGNGSRARDGHCGWQRDDAGADCPAANRVSDRLLVRR